MNSENCDSNSRLRKISSHRYVRLRPPMLVKTLVVLCLVLAFVTGFSHLGKVSDVNFGVTAEAKSWIECLEDPNCNTDEWEEEQEEEKEEESEGQRPREEAPEEEEEGPKFEESSDNQTKAVGDSNLGESELGEADYIRHDSEEKAKVEREAWNEIQSEVAHKVLGQLREEGLIEVEPLAPEGSKEGKGPGPNLDILDQALGKLAESYDDKPAIVEDTLGKSGSDNKNIESGLIEVVITESGVKVNYNQQVKLRDNEANAMCCSSPQWRAGDVHETYSENAPEPSESSKAVDSVLKAGFSGAACGVACLPASGFAAIACGSACSGAYAASEAASSEEGETSDINCVDQACDQDGDGTSESWDTDKDGDPDKSCQSEGCEKEKEQRDEEDKSDQSDDSQDEDDTEKDSGEDTENDQDNEDQGDEESTKDEKQEDKEKDQSDQGEDEAESDDDEESSTPKKGCGGPAKTPQPGATCGDENMEIDSTVWGLKITTTNPVTGKKTTRETGKGTAGCFNTLTDQCAKVEINEEAVDQGIKDECKVMSPSPTGPGKGCGAKTTITPINAGVKMCADIEKRFVSKDGPEKGAPGKEGEGLNCKDPRKGVNA